MVCSDLLSTDFWYYFWQFYLFCIVQCTTEYCKPKVIRSIHTCVHLLYITSKDKRA